MNRFRLLSSRGRHATATLDAIFRSHAVIEFEPDGTIIRANDAFLSTMGYAHEQIRGQHHRMFLDPSERDNAEYQAFWSGLRTGKPLVARVRRIAKDGRDVWLEASYNPVKDRSGRTSRVVKMATDVSEQQAELADLTGQVGAINKSQAVIEFELDGTIRTANAAFLRTTGYALDEVRGRNHRMFVGAEQAASDDYEAFWNELRRGYFKAGQFKRFGKSGAEIWIEGCYNPILDARGRPFKVVKFATDISGQVALLANLKTVIDENFRDVDHAVEQSTQHVTRAAWAIGETSTAVQTMAASTEQLSASVGEIAAVMARSKDATDGAQAQTDQADQASRELNRTATAMQAIVGLIRTIAGQINLLSLNATIEAARAGDAGRGFAVVAGEVKALARQAADATDQISSRIGELETVSGKVLEAFRAVNTAVEQVRGFVIGAATAVEEQSVVTQDLSGNMQRTARSAAAINDNVREIASAVAHTSTAIGNTRRAAEVLVR